jgi:hypothetical protein
VRRGPRDHLEAIIYMSRATPRKAKGAAGWPGSRPAGPPSDLPSPTGTMVPPVPPVPRVSKTPLGGLVGRPEPRETGLRLPRRALASRAGPCGRVVPAKRRGLGAARRASGRRPDPRLLQLWFARPFDSTGCRVAASTFRPVVCRARRPGGRRLLVTVVATRARPEPPFGAAPRPARNARRRARKRE